MRWAALVLTVLLIAGSGCSVRPSLPLPPPPAPQPAPPAKPPLPPSTGGAPGLTARPDGGWSFVGASSGSPLGVWWLGPDRALVRWLSPDMAESYHRVDLTAGTAEPVSFEHLQSVSPDGRYAVDNPRGSFQRVVYETATGKEIWRSPSPVLKETWLTPALLHVQMEQQASFLYDLVSGTETDLGGPAVSPVLLAGGQICFASYAPQETACAMLDGSGRRPLTPAQQREDVHHLLGRFAASPDGRRVAFLYAEPDRLGWLRLGPATAAAFSPAIYSWVDTLGIYDADSGAVVRYPLPRAAIPTRLVWSADSKLVGLGLVHTEGKGFGVKPKGRTDLFTLDAATGRFNPVGTISHAYDVPRLYRVLPGGELLYQAAFDGQPESIKPGAKPKVWRPGRTVLPETIWGDESVLAFQGQEQLEVHLPDGASYTYAWEGGSPHAMVMPGPGGKWAAFHSNEPASVTFLKR